MSNSIAPGSSADVNVQVRALTDNPNVSAQYKTVILKKNLVNGVNTLTQAMMSAQNTKYVVKYDFTLGEDITVPANCVLEFDGGSISGAYTLTVGKSKILGGKNCFGNDITISIDSQELYYSWFKNSEINDIISQLLNTSSSYTPIILFIDDSVQISDTIQIDANSIQIDGLNNIISCNNCDGVIIYKSGLRGMSSVSLRNIQLDGIDATHNGITFEGLNGSTVHSVSIQNCKVTNFDIGVYYKSHEWLNTLQNCSIYNNITGIKSLQGLDNAGENERIVDSVIANNDVGIICDNATFYITNCSLDYNGIDIKTNVGGDCVLTNCHIEKRYGVNCGRNENTPASFIATDYVHLVVIGSNFAMFANSDYPINHWFGIGDHGDLNLVGCKFYSNKKFKYLTSGNEGSFNMSGSSLYFGFPCRYISPKSPNLAEPIINRIFDYLDKDCTLTVWAGNNGSFQTRETGSCVFYVPINTIGIGTFNLTSLDDMSDKIYKKITFEKGYKIGDTFTSTKVIINEADLQMAQNDFINASFNTYNCNCLRITLTNIVGDTKSLKYEINVENSNSEFIEKIDSIDSVIYNTPQREFILSTTRQKIRVIGRGVAVDMNGNNIQNNGTTSQRPTTNVNVGFKYFDTTIGKPVFVSAVNGNTVTWVDATGATV